MNLLRVSLAALVLAALVAPGCSDAGGDDLNAPPASGPAKAPPMPSEASSPDAQPGAPSDAPQTTPAAGPKAAALAPRRQKETSATPARSPGPQGVSLNMITGETKVIPSITQEAEDKLLSSGQGIVALGELATAAPLPDLEPPNPHKVIGDDQRYPRMRTDRYPMRTTVKLLANWSGSLGNVGGGCSGTVVGDRFVLTAAHCVYSRKARLQSGTPTGRATSVRVIPGMEEDFMPFGDASVIDVKLPDRWKQNSDNGGKEEPSDDIALLVLDRRIGNLTGSMRLLPLTDSQLRGRGFGMEGYPGDLPNHNARRGRLMYRSDATITDITSDLIYHDGDTFGGQSGSCLQVPVDNTYYIVGVHRGGYDDDENIARRMSSSMVATIISWANGSSTALPDFALTGNPGWEPLQGGTFFHPTGIKKSEGAFEIFVHGTDDAIWTNLDNMGTKSGWVSLGGNATRGVAALSLGTNEYVFAHSEVTGGVMVKKKGHAHSWTAGGWTEISPVGRPSFRVHTPKVIALNNSTFQLFGIATNGHIFTTNCSPLLSCDSWADIGGDTVDVSAARIQDTSASRFMVTFRDHHGTVFSRENINNVWQPSWTQIPGGALLSHASLVSVGPNLANMFGRGFDGVLYHQWKATTGGWNVYDSVGAPGDVTSEVAAATKGLNDLLLVSRTGLGRLAWRQWNSGVWTNWAFTDLGTDGDGGFIEEPSMAWVTPTRLAAVARGRDTQLYFRTFNGTSWQLACSPPSWAHAPPASSRSSSAKEADGLPRPHAVAR